MSFGDEHDGQTRTRLPESAPGTTRPPARSSRSLVAVIGVVVLLVAAIALANRGDGASSDSAGQAGGSGPNAPTRSAAPTAATGVRPVTGKNGQIPTGFAHDEQGAQSAAANYAVALGSVDMFAAASRGQIVHAVYAPDVIAAQQGELDKVYSDKGFLTRIGLNEDGSAPAGLTFISRVLPAGSKVETYSGDRATVAVWYSSLFGLAGDGSKSPVTEAWYTSTYELRWVDGDWKVAGFSQKDGPVPVGRDQTASTAEEMADAVGTYGGFTYAR